jgi:hypothetical protein
MKKGGVRLRLFQVPKYPGCFGAAGQVEPAFHPWMAWVASSRAALAWNEMGSGNSSRGGGGTRKGCEKVEFNWL